MFFSSFLAVEPYNDKSESEQLQKDHLGSVTIQIEKCPRHSRPSPRARTDRLGATWGPARSGTGKSWPVLGRTGEPPPPTAPSERTSGAADPTVILISGS